MIVKNHELDANASGFNDDCSSKDELLLKETNGGDLAETGQVVGYIKEDPFSDSDIVVEEMCTLHRAIWKRKDKKVLRYLSRKSKEHKINKQDNTGR